jgi:hypothetical protein
MENENLTNDGIYTELEKRANADYQDIYDMILMIENREPKIKNSKHFLLNEIENLMKFLLDKFIDDDDEFLAYQKKEVHKITNRIHKKYLRENKFSNF